MHMLTACCSDVLINEKGKRRISIKEKKKKRKLKMKQNIARCYLAEYVVKRKKESIHVS